MKYIVCFSGGHDSAICAVEAVRKHGKDNVILLNHDISQSVEHSDIKRFKKEVADYLGIDITFANSEDFENNTPLDIAIKKNAFGFKLNQSFCTSVLKTEPFHKWLSENCQDKDNFTILYGFNGEEPERISRRKIKMMSMGFRTEYPLVDWDKTIWDIEEIGIQRPITYKVYLHANCVGCLKAGKQHWYCVYCLRKDIYEKAMEAEEKIGYTIINGTSLKDMIPLYEDLLSRGICPNDKENPKSFWSKINYMFPDEEHMPCDCSFI